MSIAGISGSANVGIEQLSSGRRITQAAIDPAGLAVETNLDTASASTRAAIGNSLTGTNIIETADGAAGGITDTLQRMRELAVAASSDTTGPEARSSYQAEFAELAKGIDSTAGSTNFNGIQLTDGSVGSLDVQSGEGSGDQINIGLSDLSTGALGLGGVNLSSSGNARSALDSLDAAIESVSSQRSDLGATQNRLESSISSATTYAENLDAAASTIGDVDIAQAVLDSVSSQMRMNTKIAAQTQAANMNRTAVMGLLG